MSRKQLHRLAHTARNAGMAAAAKEYDLELDRVEPANGTSGVPGAAWMQPTVIEKEPNR